MLYPAVVTVVALSFAAIVLEQYRRRRRPYQLVWAVSLTLGGLAGLCFLLFLGEARNPIFFRLYYACGGLLMAAYLGLGSIYLLAPRRVAHTTAAGVVGLSAVGLAFLFATPIDRAALHGSNLEAGSNLVSGPAVAFIVLLNVFGALAVIGGACVSGWRLYCRRGPARLLGANALIAAGTVLASLAGSLARLTSSGRWFWILLAAGFVVLFAGFLLTAARPANEMSARAPLAPSVATNGGRDA